MIVNPMHDNDVPELTQAESHLTDEIIDTVYDAVEDASISRYLFIKCRNNNIENTYYASIIFSNTCGSSKFGPSLSSLGINKQYTNASEDYYTSYIREETNDELDLSGNP